MYMHLGKVPTLVHALAKVGAKVDAKVCAPWYPP